MTAAVHVHPAQLPRQSELSDDKLVERIRAGESRLYAIIMRRYNQRLYRCARSIVRDEVEAEDVVQQAYVSAYQSLDRYRGGSKLGTWLARITINEALGRIRRNRRLQPLPESPVSEEAALHAVTHGDPESGASRGEIAELLEETIDELPESYRVVVVMRDVDGMSTAETAEALDMSPENVRVRLHRARGLLRQALYERVRSNAREAFGFAGERCDRIVRRVFERIEAA